MTDITNLDDLEVMLKAAARLSNPNIAQSDRELVKVSTLLSIARSLESTRVPDNWEALESPSGAILGWFDPQVARTIAQALAASQGQQQPDADDEPLPITVGSVVVLTDALELAGDDPVQVEALTMGEVLELGRTEDEPYAIVRWLDDTDAEPGKVWVSALTALEQRETEPTEADVHTPAPGEAEWLDEHRDELKANLVPAETDEDDDDIDADFDTVVEPENAAPVDGLSALKGKSKGKGGK